MLIYVTENNGVYNPLVDISNDTLYIPHWPCQQTHIAEKEGGMYRDAGAILAYVYHDTFVKLSKDLEAFTEKVAKIRDTLAELNPYASQDSLMGFMLDNQSMLQGSGTYLKETPEGFLEAISQEEAMEIMEEHRSYYVDDEDCDECEYYDDEDYDCYHNCLHSKDEDIDDDDDINTDDESDDDVLEVIRIQITNNDDDDSVTIEHDDSITHDEVIDILKVLERVLK